MKDKKKLIILTSIILGVLVLTLRLAYAAFTYTRTGVTSELILGDIWMHYKEGDTSINMEDIVPFNLYQVNSKMHEQSNELKECVNYFYSQYNMYDYVAYCQGTGVNNDGETLQEYFSGLSTSGKDNLLNKNIIIKDGDNYIVNPIMTSQNLDDELGLCMNFALENKIGEPKDFCLGTAKVEGYNFQELLSTDYFSTLELQKLIDKNIIKSNKEKLEYFEFQVDGKNTYTKEDIWYEIVLSHGDDVIDKTTRILDKFLNFSLVEVNNGVEDVLFTNKSFEDLTNKRIWVETINRNTLTEISKTYRLYMWLNNNINICGGNGSTDCDYYLDSETNNWNDVFASIKVNVNGDFNEKTNEMVESCFTYEEVPDISEIYIYEYDGEYRTYNLNTTPEGVLACMDFMMEQFDEDASAKKDRFESFCNGVGTIYFDNSIYEYLYYYVDDDVMDSLVAKNIFIPVENGEIMVEITDYDITCGRDVVVPGTLNGKKVVSLGDSSFYKKGIKSIDLPNTLKVIKFSALYKNALTHIELPDGLIHIGSYAINSNELQEIKFPESLKMIGAQTFYANQLTSIEIPLNSNLFIEVAAFGVNNLSESQAYIYGSYGDKIIGENPTTLVSYGGTNKNIVIPNVVTKLSEYSFGGSSIENIEISDSVTTIGKDAFGSNKLETVTIGSGIQYIDRQAFSSDSSSNPNLSSITFTGKTCEEIKNIEASSTDTNKYFPWLSYSSPYYHGSYKATIYGTDGACSY